MHIFIAGFTVALGLIVAIGAQNAWVLGMSIKRIHPWSIAIVCFSIDGILMAVGVLFLQQIQLWLPAVIPWLTYLGILMLLWLCFGSLKRVVTGESVLDINVKEVQLTATEAISLAAAMSLLNPHVYLDTVVLIGSVAVSQVEPWLFWAGSASASVVWFSALAAIGKPLRKWLSSTLRWRVFDSIIAVVMATVAWSLYQNL